MGKSSTLRVIAIIGDHIISIADKRSLAEFVIANVSYIVEDGVARFYSGKGLHLSTAVIGIGDGLVVFEENLFGLS